MKYIDYRTDPFSYGYDFQSRMTSMGDTDGAIFAYAFDGEGNRIRQDLNGCLSTRMVYDGANAVVEMNASNEVVWAWIHGPGLDQPVERIAFINGTARNRQVVHADGLGSVSVLTDENGMPVQTYAYAAFGGIREQTGADLNRVTFTAREALGDSLGFIYYRHRVYDPNTGRFTSEDPMGFVDGANRYVYVGNNPINIIDPFGLDTYLVNREIGGSEVRSKYNPLTHTFVAVQHPDGSVSTYGWGTTYNDQKQGLWGTEVQNKWDRLTAGEAIRQGKARRVGGTELDPYVPDAYEDIENDPTSLHRWLLWNNCKNEARDLIRRAKSLQKSDTSGDNECAK